MTPEEMKAQNDALCDKVEKMCKELYPFVDAIHVFFTKHENNEVGTSRYDFGLGNWYARYGQIREWVETANTPVSKEDEE